MHPRRLPTELEEADEREEVIVSGQLAGRLGEHVPALVPGITISEAIELVFRAQEPHLRTSPSPTAEPVKAPRRACEPLDARAASALTERIREATHQVCLPLLEAHERRAARATGAGACYVQKEFSLSRRRSYELAQERIDEALAELPNVKVTA
ncbi:MAG TPA: hypothetical protein VFN71_10205 [Methylomirabilota bacterium]|nr:hypothetical protein [Methylomirabilota bacterium]